MGLTRSAHADRDGDRMAGAARSGRRGEAATQARILLVGDEEDARAALETNLRSEGFAVSTAPNGEAALAEATRAPPDLVLTDLQMQPMDGVELCRRLHQIDPDLPVIVMTVSPTCRL
jgi:CheY-like chemotaxis protein